LDEKKADYHDIEARICRLQAYYGQETRRCTSLDFIFMGGELKCEKLGS
jgi:hypothetical protein